MTISWDGYLDIKIFGRIASRCIDFYSANCIIISVHVITEKCIPANGNYWIKWKFNSILHQHTLDLQIFAIQRITFSKLFFHVRFSEDRQH